VITSAGTNFLNAKFNVSNTSGGTLTDLTLVAYQKSGNTASTALKNLQNFQGLSNAALDAYATSAKPTNGMTNATTVNTNLADLQLFTETEVGTLTTDAAAELQAGEYLFPYGFIARASGSTTSRVIANGSNTGSVTVGLNVPNSNEPSSAVYRFGMTFVVFSTPVSTRVAESLEEQASSSAEIRGNASGFNTSQTVALAGSSLLQTNDKLVNACRVRTAGTVASPTAFLVTTAPTSTAGSFDQCFGAQGNRQINVNGTSASSANGSEKILAVALQADGKMVLAGFTVPASTNGADMLVMRLKPDGSFDRTFNGTGKASFNVSGSSTADRANAVVVQSDGKIVLGGCTICDSTNSNFAMIRVNADGTQDTSTFSSATGGKFILNSSYGNQDQINGLALQTVAGVDYIVAAGTSFNGTAGIAANDGAALDTTFAASGVRLFSFQGSSATPVVANATNDFVGGVAIDTNNKIIIGGNDNDANINPGSPTTKAGILRLTTTGAWDIKALNNIAAGGINGVFLQGSNAYVFGTVTPTGGNSEFLTLKFTLPQSGSTDGTLDTTWGNQSPTNGFSIVAPTTNSDTVRAAAVQSDGKIILVGRGRIGANGVSAGGSVVARLNANGTLDTGFASSGFLIVDRQVGLVDELQAAAITNAGKIVVGGYERIVSTAPIEDDMFVWQLNP
jgi:uncharacterized delta-60 repeat protein